MILPSKVNSPFFWCHWIARLLTAISILSLITLVIVRRILRSYLFKRYTCIPDLEQLGLPRKAAKFPGTAIICGGSFAGILTASVCCDHFEKVVVVEPEIWTFTAEARERAAPVTREVHGENATYNALQHKRTRVYQYAAAHTYQALLLRFARKLFPNFDSIATSWGMMIQPADLQLSLSGHVLHPPRDEYNGRLPETVWATRRDLEALFRKLVYDAHPKIVCVQGTLTAFQLVTERRGPPSVSAITIRLPDGRTQEIGDCALAIDCTGASQTGFKALSRVLPALSAPGLRDSYNPNIAYSTVEYPLPPKFDDNLRAVLPRDREDMAGAVFTYIPDPDVDSRMVSLIRRDANAVSFTMGGWVVDIPCTLDDVRSFAKQVKNQEHIAEYFYKAVDLLEPVKDLAVVHEARVTACHKIHYERLHKDLPRNFIAIGDASLRVNPRFGQGVAKCAIGVTTLDTLLRMVSPTQSHFGATFFRKMEDRTGHIWDGTRFADYGVPTTTPVAGESHRDGRFLRWYRGQLTRLMSKDPVAASAVWHTMMFLAPPMDVFAPSILIRVLWDNIVHWSD
ncbi:hypothetical protein AURDEDRAFT_139022 [Auricularia subglabra TFB-10046 SS5]|nr:hypothetical protein AURDEDRAFT_139022 [Auricularia subglabra TFB-10046 SS5]